MAGAAAVGTVVVGTVAVGMAVVGTAAVGTAAVVVSTAVVGMEVAVVSMAASMAVAAAGERGAKVRAICWFSQSDEAFPASSRTACGWRRKGKRRWRGEFGDRQTVAISTEPGASFDLVIELIIRCRRVTRCVNAK